LNQGMVNLMEDLQKTNRRTEETARRLSVANTDLENFAYSVSHDLRAPLRGISGFAQILVERYQDTLDEEGHKYLGYVIQASNQMGELIDDLLQYSRLGRKAIQVRPIDCGQVLDDVLAYLGDRITQCNADITLPKEYPVIDANKTLLHQIFLNLIENALIYQKVDQQPIVQIACQQESDYAIISIQDNGIGIPEEYYEKIFNMFQRLHHDNEYSGTGIGLALVKKAVTLLDGDVWVESVLGEGSTFWVKLPAQQVDSRSS
jgi:light-regulated signal transduction histidine kinase (bacteriophytochrome)